MVFFDRELAQDFAWRVKQAGQLASKMRFISAPWVGLLDNNTWLRNAQHANAMAQRLYAGLLQIQGIQVLHEPEANGVFVQLPKPLIDALHAHGWKFYEFIAGGGCRFMCAWDTLETSIDSLLADIKALS